jgi:hypothetical protein
MLQEAMPPIRERATGGEEQAVAWLHVFLELGNQLHFAVKQYQVSDARLQAAA